MFKRVGFWISLVVALVIVGAGGYIYLNRQGDAAGSATTFRVAGGESGAAAPAMDTTSTVQILPAESIIGEVSASGNIALSSRHYVALGVEGTVAQVYVKVGD